jgi:RNA polymerase sigma factor (sigma-70 family)
MTSPLFTSRPHPKPETHLPPLRTDLSDIALIERTRRGDRAAYGELWQRHAASARTVARSYSSLDPDDLVAESFTKIYDAILGGGGPTGGFRPYLFTTIRNTASSWGRDRRETNLETLESFEDPDTSESATLDSLDRSTTAQAFRSLPTRWQEVLWYSEVEGMNPQQIAPLVGMSANATAALAYRAREGLRQAWIQAHLRNAADEPECRWTIDRLGSYTRGRLRARDTAKLEAHLDDCARCTIVAAEAREVGSHLALVLLPLTAGVGGATAYSAWLSQGAPAAHVALGAASLPSGLGGSATGSSAAGAGGSGTGGSGTGGGSASAAGSAGGTGAGASGGVAVGTGVAIGAGTLALAAAAVAAIIVVPSLTASFDPAPSAAPVAQEPAGSPADAPAPPPVIPEPVLTEPVLTEPVPTPPVVDEPENEAPVVDEPEIDAAVELPALAPPPAAPPPPAPTPTPTPTPDPDPVDNEALPVTFTADSAGGLVDPLLQGTAEPSASVVVTASDGRTWPKIADDDGAWSIIATDSPAGPTSYTAVQTDAAGNTSPESDPQTVVLSTPSLVVSTSAWLIGWGWFDGEPNAIVEVLVGGDPLGTVQLDDAGKYDRWLGPIGLLGDVGVRYRADDGRTGPAAAATEAPWPTEA